VARRRIRSLHSAYVSHVDLETAAVLRTWPVSADVGDVVLAGNGYAYAFPRVDQWVDIHSVTLTTGAESGGSRGRIVRYCGCRPCAVAGAPIRAGPRKRVTFQLRPHATSCVRACSRL